MGLQNSIYFAFGILTYLTIPLTFVNNLLFIPMSLVGFPGSFAFVQASENKGVMSFGLSGYRWASFLLFSLESDMSLISFIAVCFLSIPDLDLYTIPQSSLFFKTCIQIVFSIFLFGSKSNLCLLGF